MMHNIRYIIPILSTIEMLCVNENYQQSLNQVPIYNLFSLSRQNHINNTKLVYH